MELTDSLAVIFRLSLPHQAALRRLHLETARDLLFYFPSRIEESGVQSPVAGLVPGESANVVGVLQKITTKKSWRRKVPVSEGVIKDATGQIKAMWFNQPYLAKMWAEGTAVRVIGKVSGSMEKPYLANPELSRASLSEAGLFSKSDERVHELSAVYPETSGVTSLWLRHAIQKILASGVLEKVEDPVPEAVLKKYHLPSLKTALAWFHTPRTRENFTAARKRFSFEEIFFIQLERQRERAQTLKAQSFPIETPQKEVRAFTNTFPFALTASQEEALEAILQDMRSGHPLSRLLEGDVGSGKTAVAAAAAYAVTRVHPQAQVYGALQTAYMAPTEILAKQHFDSFIEYFKSYQINIGLITGSGCYKFPSKIDREKATLISRTQLLKWVAGGEIPILIGTHALIAQSVQFKHLALVVIDEQHRFGTRQRQALARKDFRLPHLLSMTATPIPRTLALTIWGDLDLTALTDLPPGRKGVITALLKSGERAQAYEKMRSEIQNGRQAYVICPRIDEPDPEKAFALQAKSVKAEAERLAKDVFPEFKLAVLHSKMKPSEKDEVMRRFATREVDILVSTSVVEVGVNVPNATVMLIEGAERFGLSQLHQLRGRVMRSTHQAYCFCAAESRGEKTLARLKALVTAKNGFELAELDLSQRGPGQLAGGQQWGISDIGMEALKNVKLIEAARAEAGALIRKDAALQKYPLLAREVALRASALHFE